MQAIQKFVTNRNLPERLKEDITRYVESSAVIRSEHGHQEDVFSMLSHTLQAGRTPQTACLSRYFHRETLTILRTLHASLYGYHHLQDDKADTDTVHLVSLIFQGMRRGLIGCSLRPVYIHSRPDNPFPFSE